MRCFKYLEKRRADEPFTFFMPILKTSKIQFFYKVATFFSKTVLPCGVLLGPFANLHVQRAPEATRGALKTISDRFCMDFGSISQDYGHPPIQCFMILARFRYRFVASFSQDAKNRQEPAKNQQRTRHTTNSSKHDPPNCNSQNAVNRQQTHSSKRHLLKMGGGGVTPHGVFNPLRAACARGVFNRKGGLPTFGFHFFRIPPLDFSFLGFLLWISPLLWFLY